MNYKEVKKIVLPEKKQKEEKYNIFVSWFVRPLSVACTVPLVNSKVKPITITKISILCSLAGFFFVSFGTSMYARIIGWFMFFVWSVFDGVDGNLARCTNSCSLLGDLWDTMGGYLAMVLINFSAGIAGFYDNSGFVFFPKHFCIILGGAAAILAIFPRLIMHKKKSSVGNAEDIKSISDKNTFNMTSVFAMNIVSPSGFMQIIFLFSIVFHLLELFAVAYFIVNSTITAASLRRLLKE
ncbi:MAG: CDP-alcohol phosphatidyltransferase family protein [Clostridia bacterium]|nr:CDP-alcohol phosphatidyltransferase family protein [Clostridia bacterium]